MNCEYIKKSSQINNSNWHDSQDLVDYLVSKDKRSPYLYSSSSVGFVIKNSNKSCLSLPDGSFLSIPNKLLEIKNIIESSKFILDLQESWDDEGALSVSSITWINSVRFLANYSIWILQNKNIIIETPDINPCKDGSIDIVWRTSKARMILNFYDSEKGLVKYYGDHYDNINSIKGIVKIDLVQEFLASWMTCLE